LEEPVPTKAGQPTIENLMPIKHNEKTLPFPQPGMTQKLRIPFASSKGVGSPPARCRIPFEVPPPEHRDDGVPASFSGACPPTQRIRSNVWSNTHEGICEIQGSSTPCCVFPTGTPRSATRRWEHHGKAWWWRKSCGSSMRWEFPMSIPTTAPVPGPKWTSTFARARVGFFLKAGKLASDADASP